MNRKPKVFISHWMPQIGVDLIERECQVDYYNGVVPLTKEAFIARAKEADAVLSFVCDYIDEEIVRSCPGLQVLSSFGKGYDNIDVDACTKHNVLVTINADALTDSTADLAIGLLLAASRNLLPADRHVRAGRFRGWHATDFLGRDFHHSKLGIIGFGAIGQAIARRARGFDVDVIYYDIRRNRELESVMGVEFGELPDLLPQCDFLITAVDLHPGNRHLIGAVQLEMMKKDSYLINISRGSIVDERAVAEALKHKRIAGYAADVFEFEDVIIEGRPDSILQELLGEEERTVFTPHIGTGTIQARERLAISSATQLLQALRGEIPAGAVNRVPVAPLLTHNR